MKKARVMKIQYIRMNTDNTKEDKIKSTLKTVTDLVKVVIRHLPEKQSSIVKITCLRKH